MQLAIAQSNQVLGDLDGNARAIAVALAEAERGGARLLVTPELSLCGYPPRTCCARRSSTLRRGTRRAGGGGTPHGGPRRLS
jgi:predicted amidohydrolase